MIKKLFDFWKRSKEQKAARLAAKLIKVLDDIGRVKAHDGQATSVTIYEYSHIEDILELNGGREDNIEIRLNHSGKILKKMKEYKPILMFYFNHEGMEQEHIDKLKTTCEEIARKFGYDNSLYIVGDTETRVEIISVDKATVVEDIQNYIDLQLTKEK